MYPYPSTPPLEEVGTLLKKLRDLSGVSNAAAAHAAWVVAGYGLTQMLPDVAITSEVVVDRNLLCTYLDKLQSPHTEGLEQLPWQVILPALVNLFQEWLRHRSS